MARPPKKPPTAVDVSLFSDAELEKLENEAKAEYEKEAREEAASAFKDKLKDDLRKKAMFVAGQDADGEEVESILVDLAPHATSITLDGRKFFHGVTYKFTKAQASTVKDIMYQTWRHEREVGGANMNAEYGRTPFNRSISPNHQA